jgi:hypothetical protein
MSGSLQGTARALYLCESAKAAMGLVDASDLTSIREQMSVALDVDIDTLPAERIALARVCLASADEVLEAVMPKRGPSGALIEPDTRQPLTDKQAAIFEFIKRRIDDDKIPPSIREIGKAFKLSATNGVNQHLEALERKGWIVRSPLKSRSIRVLP